MVTEALRDLKLKYRKERCNISKYVPDIDTFIVRTLILRS